MSNNRCWESVLEPPSWLILLMRTEFNSTHWFFQAHTQQPFTRLKSVKRKRKTCGRGSSIVLLSLSHQVMQTKCVHTSWISSSKSAAAAASVQWKLNFAAMTNTLLVANSPLISTPFSHSLALQFRTNINKLNWIGREVGSNRCWLLCSEYNRDFSGATWN